jgi:hypothetical protein
MRIQDYAVEWDRQSKDSSESMPLGGHDVGCNVWVQQNQLCLYLSQSGSFDENGTMLKLGRLRLWSDDPQAFSDHFLQRLDLETGQILIEAGKEGQKQRFLLWVDVTNSNLHIDWQAEKPQQLHLSYDCWRYRDRDVLPEERGQCRDYARVGEPAEEKRVYTSKDFVIPTAHSLLFGHRNDNTRLVYAALMEQQGLTSVQAAFPNYLKDRTMGGYLYQEQLTYQGCQKGVFDQTDQEEYHFASDLLQELSLVVALETGEYADFAQWEAYLRKKQQSGISPEENKRWWKQYFENSFIAIDEEHPGSEMWKIGRNYQLFRYMLGCNYYGEWPTKFNGGLFTFYECYTPDYRNWSGIGFTAQNQRLVYWPMLKSGDFAAMKPQFDFYLHLLEAGKMRASFYWGEEGAYFPEQINCFGVSTAAEYKMKRRAGVPKGEDDTPWVRMHYSTALEFALMMLEYLDYTAQENPEYIAFADQVVRFYFSHYSKGADGKLYIFPSTALETYKQDPTAESAEAYGAVDPMDAAAGLRCVLQRLIAYQERIGQSAVQYREWLDCCPELPVGEQDGKPVYLPARRYDPKPFNCELPQLYCIFPFHTGFLTDEECERGKNTYADPNLTADQRLLIGWHQNGIFAARLGMVQEAHRVLRCKLGDSERRFPVFWGPGHDWTPDHNWGGSGMIGLQEMLVQCDGEKYQLLPAWDRQIDLHFKLHLPGNRVLECELKDGVVIKEQLS